MLSSQNAQLFCYAAILVGSPSVKTTLHSIVTFIQQQCCVWRKRGVAISGLASPRESLTDGSQKNIAETYSFYDQYLHVML